jgi:hypothetical protein
MICKKCGTDSPLEAFYKNSSYKSGYSSSCKSCSRAYAKNHSRKNKDVMRERQLLHKFKLTNTEYEAKLASQGGVCQICKCPPKNLGKKFPVDHDHATGKIRDILCQSCNHMLGNAKDNPIILQNAISYLSKHA